MGAVPPRTANPAGRRHSKFHFAPCVEYPFLPPDNYTRPRPALGHPSPGRQGSCPWTVLCAQGGPKSPSSCCTCYKVSGSWVSETHTGVTLALQPLSVELKESHGKAQISTMALLTLESW